MNANRKGIVQYVYYCLYLLCVLYNAFSWYYSGACVHIMPGDYAPEIMPGDYHGGERVQNSHTRPKKAEYKPERRPAYIIPGLALQGRKKWLYLRYTPILSRHSMPHLLQCQ